MFLLSEISRHIRHGLMELRSRPVSQVPFLDFLRSIAVVSVMIAHTDQAFIRLFGKTPISRIPMVNGGGFIGIELFFVLSGFLIGSQIWKEQSRTGTVRVKDFILRRGFRIWPLYFSMFVLVVLCGRATSDHWWSDLVFLTNYSNHGVVLGSWSLCTEEQFYILAPLLVMFLARRRAHPGIYQMLILGAFLALPLIRGAEWVSRTGSFYSHNPQTFAPMYQNFHTHADGLLIGLLIANLIAYRSESIKFLRSSGMVFVALFIFFFLRQIQHEIFMLTGLSILCGSFMLWGLHSSSKLIKYTDAKIFYWISRLSYGMYLNHEYMHVRLVRTFAGVFGSLHYGHVLGELSAMFALVLFSMAVALITFCLVERPFLEMRATYFGRRSDLQKSAQLAMMRST
jgi:peptidoglycan/LPS O-acetylase OafA/YrhL